MPEDFSDNIVNINSIITEVETMITKLDIIKVYLQERAEEFERLYSFSSSTSSVSISSISSSLSSSKSSSSRSSISSSLSSSKSSSSISSSSKSSSSISSNAPVYNWLNIDSTYLLSGGAGVGFCGDEEDSFITEALDGNGEWEHETDHVHWFIIDLGAYYTVNYVRGRSKTNIDPVNVEIYISGNTTDWTSIATLNTWQDTTEWVVEATTVKKGRYLKVEIQTTQGGFGYIGFGNDPSPFKIFDVYATLDSS